MSDTFSTVLLTNRRKIRQQEFDSEFVFVHEGKDKDLLLKKIGCILHNKFDSSPHLFITVTVYILRKVTTRHCTEEY